MENRILFFLSSLKQALEQQEQKWIVLEECKNSVQQEAATLRSSMRELEKTHLQSRRELQELRRQVKEVFQAKTLSMMDYL